MINSSRDLERIYKSINERHGISKAEMDDFQRASRRENRYNQEVMDLQSQIEREEELAQRDERNANENSAARRRERIAQMRERLNRAKTNKDRFQNKKEKIDNPS